jgi:hypothetical protein
MNQDISSMPDPKHADLVNQILGSLEKNLGIRVVQWERVSGERAG